MSQLDKLKQIFNKMQRVVIGYSGGIDSTLLAYLATKKLGENAVSILLISKLTPADQIEDAIRTAQTLNLNLKTIEIDPLTSDDVCSNPPNRCYYCKKIMFGVICEEAKRLGIDTVIDGANMDDMNEFRPGTRAIAELGVISPYKELNIKKEEIRAIARSLDIPNWNKPSYACLASRIPYGTEITTEILHKIDEAESVLSQLGFRQFRVRHHGEIARIELVPIDMEKAITHTMRIHIVKELKRIGYHYVTLDMVGYRTGSMNEILDTSLDF